MKKSKPVGKYGP